jgi:hypothetical protein
MTLQAETFELEIGDALQNYDKFVVCLDKTPEDFLHSLQSLLKKAITAYENRAPGLRHGIALDRHVTIMLSQTDTERPLCGIYFNLHTPFRKPAAAKES